MQNSSQPANIIPSRAGIPYIAFIIVQCPAVNIKKSRCLLENQQTAGLVRVIVLSFFVSLNIAVQGLRSINAKTGNTEMGIVKTPIPDL